MKESWAGTSRPRLLFACQSESALRIKPKVTKTFGGVSSDIESLNNRASVFLKMTGSLTSHPR
jgi:hypothetical protein